MSDARRDGEPAGAAANLVVALVIAGIGGAGMAGSWALGLGSAAAPSAGTWPFLVSTAIAVLGVVLALLARRTNDAEGLSSSGLPVLGAVAGMAGFAALVGVIGFEIPGALLVFAWLRFLGRESWRLSALGAVGIVAVFYLIFVGALNVPIPHLF